MLKLIAASSVAIAAALALAAPAAAMDENNQENSAKPAPMEQGASMQDSMAGAAPGQVKKIVASWPSVSQKAANAMIKKYGQPDGATKSMLVWEDTGPFVRTIVYSEEIQHDFPIPHKDVLEQFVHYDVPADKFDDLAHFDGSIIAERTKGELSARCDKEENNILGLNLAQNVISGKMSVEEARQTFTETVKQAMSGESKTPQLMASLQFEPSSTNITNPGETTIQVAARQ